MQADLRRQDQYCDTLCAALGRTREEIEKYGQAWRLFATACKPYRALPNPLKKRKYAEKVLEFGMPMLLIFTGCVGGITLALEVEHRLLQISAILEGKQEEAEPNLDPEDPYNNTLPTRLDDTFAPPAERKVYSELLYLYDYIAKYTSPNEIISQYDMFA
jgi:hypothetical protein